VDGIPVLLADGSMNTKFAVFIITFIMSVGWVVLQADKLLYVISSMDKGSLSLLHSLSLTP
jgi:hypothetical protein